MLNAYTERNGKFRLRTSESANPGSGTRGFLMDRFRCPDGLADFVVPGDLSDDSGYFRLGSQAICYGQCSSGTPSNLVTGSLHDASEHVVVGRTTVQLPFDPARVVDNLRCERYRSKSKELSESSVLRSAYYMVRPFLGVSGRKHIQKLYFRGWDKVPFPSWPVDRTVEHIFEYLLALSMQAQSVERIPFIWFWPDAALSCTMMTHDVETRASLAFCRN